MFYSKASGMCSLKSSIHFQFKSICSSKMWVLKEGKVVLPYFKWWSTYFFKSVLNAPWHFFRSVISWQSVKKGINSPYTNAWWNASSIKKTALVLYQFLNRGRHRQSRSPSSYTKRGHSSAAKGWIWPSLHKTTGDASKRAGWIISNQHQLRYTTMNKGNHMH